MPASIRPAFRAERNFYTLMSVAIALVVFAGFMRTFYLRAWYPEFREFAAPEAFFQWHGLVFTLWFLWLIAQAWLIRAGNFALHRTMGYVGTGLAVLVVLVGVYGATYAANRPGGFIGVPVPPVQFLAIPLFDMAAFSLFFAWAYIRRRDPQAHKRLILFASLNLVTAAVVRLPLGVVEAFFPWSMFFGTWLGIAAIVAWDLATLKRLHRVTAIATVLTLVLGFGRFWVMNTSAWAAFSSWFIELLQG